MRIPLRLALALVLLAALVYAGDYLAVRVRVAWHRDPFDVMEIQRLLTIRLKGKKIEFMLDDGQTQTCVHALFPQQGYVPCWWLARHTQQQRDL